MHRILFTVVLLLILLPSSAEDGYRLWLRYDKVKNESLLREYRSKIKSVYFTGSSPTLLAAKNELFTGLEGLLGQKTPEGKTVQEGSLLVFARTSSHVDVPNADKLGTEGFTIYTATVDKKNVTE